MLTLEPLKSSFALRADLAPLSPLIVIAISAHRESTLVASNKQLSLRREPDIIPTNLADLPAHLLQWLRLETKTPSNNQHISTKSTQKKKRKRIHKKEKERKNNSHPRLAFAANNNELIPVMRAGDKAGASLHRNGSALIRVRSGEADRHQFERSDFDANGEMPRSITGIKGVGSREKSRRKSPKDSIFYPFFFCCGCFLSLLPAATLFL